MIRGLGRLGDPVAAWAVVVPGLFVLQFPEETPVLLVVAMFLGQPSAVLLAKLTAYLGE